MARLIGLDETGKGEIIGDMVLCGTEIDSTCSDDVETCLSAANTKNRRTQAHWERVSGRLAELGVQHEIERLSPSDMPKGRTTKVMDDAYIKIIERLGPDEDTRITVDDYGIGDTLRWYLDSLPCAVTVKHGADVTHPEAKAASVLAKRVHVAMMGWDKLRSRIRGVRLFPGIRQLRGHKHETLAPGVDCHGQGVARLRPDLVGACPETGSRACQAVREVSEHVVNVQRKRKNVARPNTIATKNGT